MVDPQVSRMHTAKKTLSGCGGSEGKTNELITVTWKRRRDRPLQSCRTLSRVKLLRENRNNWENPEFWEERQEEGEQLGPSPLRFHVKISFNWRWKWFSTRADPDTRLCSSRWCRFHRARVESFFKCCQINVLTTMTLYFERAFFSVKNASLALMQV